MRIALLTDFPRNLATPFGGVEAVARSLALGLSHRADVDLHIVTTRTDVGRVTSVPLGKGLTLHCLPQIGKLELATLFLHHRFVLGRYLGQLRPDIVHANDLGRYPFACGALGYRYVLTVHGFDSIERQAIGLSGTRTRARVALLRYVEDASMRRATVIVANSSYVLQQVPRTAHQQISLIPNPVDPLFFEPEPTMSCPNRILWAGVVVRRKGVDLLVRALALVQRSVPAAHVRLIGPSRDSAYLHELQALIDELGLASSVTFVGPRHGCALRAEYASATVVTLPSREENVPVAIAEAMAVGRPVVATRVGGVADLVVDGVTGRLVPPEDVERLAHTLAQILGDEAGRREMGMRGRTIARERFALDGIVDRHLAVYRAMLANGKRA